jgi:putative ABC transport system permease protein
LVGGEVVLGSALAQRAGLTPGKEIVLETKSGARRFRVAATTNSYTVGGLVVCMEWAVGQRLLGADQVDAFAVKAAPGALAKVEAGLRAMARDHNFTVYSYAELSRMQEAIMSGVVGSLWGLLALAFIVAAFGIANTLTMNVLEQTREIAILRVLGMSRRQVRKMVLSQALIMGTMGLLTGLIAGLTTVYVIDLCMLPLIGHAVVMTIRPLLLLGCFAVALAVVLLAAWMPAERATRLDLLIALHYE